MKNCLIIEDSVECQSWLNKIVLSAFPTCDIDEALNLKSAFAAIEQTKYDLALIDLTLPDGNGIEALRDLNRKTPNTICVIITAIGEDTQIVAALAAGAQGYLLKEQPATLLSRQLAELSAGVPALSPSIARRIMHHFQRTGPVETGDEVLTEREKEILGLISHGLRNAEAAQRLSIAPTTVASHVKSIYRKLRISSRAEASWHATRLGL